MKKWTEEEDNLLMTRRVAGASPKDLHGIMPYRSLGAVHARLNVLRKRYSLVYPHGNISWTDEELLDAVRKYKTTEALNNFRLKHEPWATTVCSRFGGWGEALKLIGLPSNVGGLDSAKCTAVYLVYLSDCDLYKVGLTQQDIKQRFQLRKSIKIVDSIDGLELDYARNLERELLNILKPYKAIDCPDYMYRDGHTECFENVSLTKLEDIYNLSVD